MTQLSSISRRRTSEQSDADGRPRLQRFVFYIKPDLLFVYSEEVVDSQSGVDEEDGVLPPLQTTDLTFQPQTLCCGAVLQTHTHTD